MLKIRLILLILVVTVLVTACSGPLRYPKWQLPRHGPVDVFLGLIDQVKNIGQSVARQFGGMGGHRH